jgi:hypothetical protein
MKATYLSNVLVGHHDLGNVPQEGESEGTRGKILPFDSIQDVNQNQ